MNSVKVGGYEYATLDGACADALYGKAKAMYGDKTCQRAQFKRAVPAGWELAPYERTLLTNGWSTHCLVFNDGRSFGTKGWAANQYKNCGSNLLRNDRGRYYVSSCSRRIAIRRHLAPKNGVVIDSSVYMTLDEVNPHAWYGKSKGLSDSTCHRRNHARAIPAGWELAPEPNAATTRKILALPWSTHCLVFANGQSRGTSTYKRWNCLGKGYLSKTGNNYYARSCSLRVLLRKKESCVRPSGWCGHKGATYRYHDCDGDGIKDHHCYDNKGNSGVIESSRGCRHTWPRGKCPKQGKLFM